ncbi:MAG: hypothetical protein OCD76_06725 [Reichenbachiella sp.]
MKIGMILFFLCLSASLVNGQTFSDILSPSKETLKHARVNVQEYINQVQDTLEITPKQAKVRKLKLTPCEDFYPALGNSALFDDASEFLSNSSCAGIFRYQHPLSEHGKTHYLVTFYFDITGKLISAESEWILIIR